MDSYNQRGAGRVPGGQQEAGSSRGVGVLWGWGGVSSKASTLQPA